jgi:hypothetical protein
MSFWEFADKHIVVIVGVGTIALVLAGMALCMLENYAIARLEVKRQIETRKGKP